VDGALLEDADMSSGRVSVHDLYRQFAELESKGKFKARGHGEADVEFMLRTHFPKSLREMSQGVVGIERLTRLCISASYEETLRKPIMNVGTRGSNRNIPQNLRFWSCIFSSERTRVLNLNDLVRSLEKLRCTFCIN
jgi:hypothetical protein